MTDDQQVAWYLKFEKKLEAIGCDIEGHGKMGVNLIFEHGRRDSFTVFCSDETLPKEICIDVMMSGFKLCGMFSRTECLEEFPEWIREILKKLEGIFYGGEKCTQQVDGKDCGEPVAVSDRCWKHASICTNCQRAYAGSSGICEACIVKLDSVKRKERIGELAKKLLSDLAVMDQEEINLEQVGELCSLVLSEQEAME